MFYKCQKCNKTWQHPIKKCPYCFSELKKLKNSKAKVFAISKVLIPSLTHPNVPYYALILEDENGNKWAHKSIKEHKVGDEIEFEKNENAVSIIGNKYDATEAISKAVELLDLKLKSDLKVLIIPQLETSNHAYLRENTSSQFLNAVLDFLLENNIKNIKIATQSFNEIPVEASAQKSGLLDIAMKKNIIPFDLAKTTFIKKDDLEISEEVLNADLVLNLCTPKMGKAESTSNLFKALNKENFEKLKYISSLIEISEKLNNALPNVISIADAESVQKSNKLNTYLGLVMASKNTLKLDKVFNEIVETKMPEILKDVNNIQVIGRSIEEVKYNAEIN